MPRRLYRFLRFGFPDGSRPESAVPWPLVRWEYSLLLPIAIVLMVVTLIVAEPRKEMLHIQVVSAVSGAAMPGTLVQVGDDAYLTDGRGEVRLARPEAGMPIRARAEGFSEVGMPAPEDRGVRVIQMQPLLMNGVVRDAETWEPIAGAEIVLFAGGQEIASSRSDAGGAYIFKNVPEGAQIQVQANGYEAVELGVGSRSRLDIELARAESCLDDTCEPLEESPPATPSGVEGSREWVQGDPSASLSSLGTDRVAISRARVDRVRDRRLGVFRGSRVHMPGSRWMLDSLREPIGQTQGLPLLAAHRQYIIRIRKGMRVIDFLRESTDSNRTKCVFRPLRDLIRNVAANCPCAVFPLKCPGVVLSGLGGHGG